MPGHSLSPMDQFHPQGMIPQHQQPQFHQQPQPSADDLAALAALARPISLSLSRFSRECTASVVFSLQDSNQVLAPWNSIYIPKHYRVPVPGQRQSSPGECDLVLKIFPRLETSTTNLETIKMQELVMPCERCRLRKRDIFQIIGPDPNVPSPQRLFFSTGEIRLFFKILCPPGHHTTPQENASYVLTFELHHGKRILMSETVRNAGPGLFPEPAPTIMDFGAGAPRSTKRKMSTSPPFDQESDNTLSRKRSAIMSLDHLISANGASAQIDSSAPSSATTLTDPHSPTAVVPSSPNYHNEHEESGVRSRTKSMSFEDQAPTSWSYGKGSRSSSERAEDSQPNQPKATTNTTKPSKKRQEPHELSELGIGQRASANLHAAYVNSQLKELSKAGLPTDGVVIPEGITKPKSTKPKPSHACPEPDCDKSFSRLFNLRSHMRTHSKARPFVCESCQFAFSRRHDRDRHAKKHLSEKPYKCIVCEATFVRQDALVRHLRMDGVLNQCMAAMEQRAMQLGDNNSGYMLAAKQQAHDEQQQEDQRDDDGKQVNREVNSAKKIKPEENNESTGSATTNGASGDDELVDTKDSTEKAPEINAPSTGSSVVQRQPATVDSSNTTSRDGSTHPPKGTFSRPPSPRHQSTPKPTVSTFDGHSNYDSSKPHPYSSVPPPLAQQEYYADERYGGITHPRSFYPSPSRTHSRSHSQSQPQPYPAGPEYHSPNHPESGASGYSYHGVQSKYPAMTSQGSAYRDHPSGYGYQRPPSPMSTLARYNERPLQGQDSRGYSSYVNSQGVDHYDPYPPRDSTLDKPDSSITNGPQPWTGMNGFEAHELTDEPDKSIFDAAVGLLRIRSSHW